MGVIKDGKIYGNLPIEEAFAVHYPAYTSSVERAIDTLGGTQGISKARASDTNKLELRFRPEDPYSHPAIGELQLCNNFLLKISKVNVVNAQEEEVRSTVSKGLSSANFESFEKQKSITVLTHDAEKPNKPLSEPVALDGQIESLIPQEAEDHFTADIIACVPKAYHFNGMADYQHIPAIHAEVARKKKKIYAEFENGGFMDVDQDDLVAILPPLFSNKDLPTNVVLRPSASIVSLKRRPDGLADRYWECDIEPSLALDFFINEIPKKVDWEKHIPRNSKQWEWQKAVCELFDERPIWVKESISVRLLEKGLKFQGNMLRKLLFRTAYYFSNGPFLRFWIRKGYDPRKDPESRIYQRTDFRVPPSLRSYCDANFTSGSKRWRDMCNFQKFPNKCFTSFQLFELADDYIQEEIRKPPTQSTCSCATGWFSFTVLQTFRFCVAVRFLSVYPNGGANLLLKSASRRFEKSKRLCLFPKDVQQNEEQEANNTEIIDNEDNEPNNSDDEEEDDDDEIEDDNVEDDLEAYEALDLDGNFSPRPHSESNDENLSRNFLQELFVNFPDNNGVDDNEPSHANGIDGDGDGDGEYHIYEHSSDYSEDND